VAVSGLWLGSLPLPYATLLFSHAQVSGLIGIAMWAMAVFEERRCETTEYPSYGRLPSPMLGSGRNPAIRWRMGIAGCCLGLAVASE